MSELELLKKRIRREISARKAAEAIIESKSLQLYEANEKLHELNRDLEAKVAERTEQLTESERRYRLLVESAKEIIYNCDITGSFVYTNRMAREILGYTDEEIIGKHFTDFTAEGNEDKVLDFYTYMRDNEVENTYMEVPVKTRTGHTVWLGQNVRRIVDNGSVIFSVVARDITKQKEIEEALEKAQKTLMLSEQKYRSMIENLKLGILEVDQQGNVIKAYDEFCDIVEYTPDELIGLNPEDFLLNDAARKIIADQHEKRGQGISAIYEIPITTKSGAEKWLLISGAPFYNLDEEIIGSIGIHYDITHQKNLQRELEIARKNAEKAQAAEKLFLANMSHEIRTPLNAIIGMSHLIRDTPLTAEQKGFLDILANSANLLHTLISDILDISKIDSGHIETKMMPVNLISIGQNIINTFSLKAGSKGVVLEMDCDKDIHTEVLTDELLLNQILMNLVGNAVKFTDEGSVRLIINKESQDGEIVHIRFDIEDTGIGINKSMKPLIFDKFRQANDTRSKKYSGTGLGLSITRSLVEILGGEISFESIEGVGTRFTFILPFQNTKKEIKAIQVKSTVPVDFQFSGKHILIAEDNPMNQKYICTLMDKWQITYDLVEDGEDAVHQARLVHYDLIFMDLQMPRLGGLEATQQIIQNSLNPSTPIIALTASTFLTKKQLALKAGMNAFLAKPFTPAQLLGILNEYMGTSIKEQTTPSISFSFDDALSQETLKEIYGDDIEYACDMFDLFLNNYQSEMDVLTGCFERKEVKEIKAQAHKMKPTYKMVGLDYLAEILQRIESEADSSKWKVLQSIFDQFQEELVKMIPVVQRQLDHFLKKDQQKSHE